MVDRIFVALSSPRLAMEIGRAEERVILAAPGVHPVVAKALVQAVERLGREAVDVVLDCAVAMCHLGYGTIEAIKFLDQHKIRMRQSPNLRVGILICDDRGWSFAPTVLCVEEEPGQDEHPNAVCLSREQVDIIASRICPPPSHEAGADRSENPSPGLAKSETEYTSEFRDDYVPSEEEVTEPEIGARPVNEMEIRRVGKKLEEAPPQKFNISRVVRVFQAYIQYVEVNLKGCSISQRKIQIPKYLLNLTDDQELHSRLRTTFNLIEKTSKLSDDSLRKDLRQVMEDFTCSLGEPYGRVMLRAKRLEFDARINALCEEIELHKEGIKSNLEKEINYSIQSIIEALLDHIIKTPPPQLRRQVIREPTEEEAAQWLCDELLKVFPAAEDLISEMKLIVHFKGITYETLKDDNFEHLVRNAFPYVDWDTIFNEYDAAQSKQDA